MSPVEWKERVADPARVSGVAAKHGIPEPLARAIVARGFVVDDDIASYLSSSLKDISDPFSIAGMQTACARLWQAIEKKEKILIYGDYDCDGLTAVAVLYLFLKGVGHEQVEIFIPDRLDDGYGLMSDCLKRCFDEHSPDLVVTVDCGINSRAEVDMVKSRGVDIIVTDHHEPADETSNPTVLVNPKIDSPASMADLAGVGVAFMLVYGTVKLSGLHKAADGFDIRQLLSLVALGTVADIVPLTRDNRILVNAGLDQLRRNPPTGLSALMAISRIVPDELESYHFGFMLGPRINAAGRLGKAELGLKLLLSEDPEDALKLAEELDAANRERKKIEDGILKEALELLEEAGRVGMGIVVAKDGWHAGTLGIVASRLVSRYNRPVAVVAFDEHGDGKGSCRSVDGVNLADVLDECDEFLASHGGHAMAAGVGLRRENLEKFTAAFAEKCAQRCAGDEFSKVYEFDGWLEPADMTVNLCRELTKMQPVGVGNASPLWGLNGLEYSSVRIFKDKHLSFMVGDGRNQLKVIGFSMADRESDLPESGRLDLLCEPKMNSFRGRTSVDLVLKDFRPAAG